MNNLAFLDVELPNEYGASDATLKAVLPGGKVVHISDKISPVKILDSCPLLYHAFEYNSQSRLQASIEASSEAAVISLTRYCYTNSYLADEPDGESILLLQHAETYKIAEDFDVPELQIMAHGNFCCQIEYACCLPNPPKDLLDTIRFIYRHFASDASRRQHNLVDTLLNYCVAVYLYHKLGESLDFLTAVHEIPPFRQDLCRTNIARNFEDDWAAEIIRLPSGPATQSKNAPTTLASRELPSLMFHNLSRETASDMKLKAPAPADKFGDSIALSSCRNASGIQPFHREVPDPSKHRVSPSALSLALERYTGSLEVEKSKCQDAGDETLRKYKRARIDETTARLEGRFVFPEAGPSSRYCKEEKFGSVEADEDAFWKGAFGQDKTQPSRVATEGTSHSARRLLFEYGRRNGRSAQLPSSPPTVDGTGSTTLPHRPRDLEPNIEVGTADTVSEDEGFAMVDRIRATVDTAPHSPMSSPELVPTASIAQTLADDEDKATSDDDWTML